MFQVEEFKNDPAVELRLKDAEKNYTLRCGDYLNIRVETNSGESLIDPNYQLRQEFGIQNLNVQNQTLSKPRYLIRSDSFVELPLVGEVKLAGLMMYQSDSILGKAYSAFYKEPFVITTVENRRVFIFNGAQTQIFPLQNENTSVIEVLASSGGIQNFAKAHNLRLIRGDLSNPYVELIDLSTIEGMKAANLQVRNMDIIYVEPVRRSFVEASRDVSPIISLVISALTITILLSR